MKDDIAFARGWVDVGVVEKREARGFLLLPRRPPPTPTTHYTPSNISITPPTEEPQTKLYLSVIPGGSVNSCRYESERSARPPRERTDGPQQKGKEKGNNSERRRQGS